MPMTRPAPEQIAEAAYFLWLAEGRPEGRDADHWHRAQAALSRPAARRPARKSAPKTAPASARKKATTGTRARKVSPADA